jgi:iron complex transport system substrate-binding protein
MVTVSQIIAAAEVRITDDLGQVISLEGPARRVISLYGAYSEIFFAMGLEDRLVARTRADLFPPAILDKPSVGTHLRPNMELVLGLQPDLIIQASGRKYGHEVIRQIAEKGRLQQLSQRLATTEHRPSVFFEVRYPNLLGAGQQSIVNDVILKAGGINCLPNRKKLVRINIETLIGYDPEVYVVQKGPMNRNPAEPKFRPNFRVIKAVEEGRVLFVDEYIFSRPGPRSVEAVEKLASFLHPNF